MASKDGGCNTVQNNLMFGFDLSSNALPKTLVTNMLQTNEYLARQSAHQKEREEITAAFSAQRTKAALRTISSQRRWCHDVLGFVVR